jgi:hypothetical protein
MYSHEFTVCVFKYIWHTLVKDLEQNLCFWQAVMSVQNDVMVEHSSVESVNSAHTQSGLSGTSSLSVNPGAVRTSRLDSTSAQQNHKKVLNELHVWK